MNPNFSDFETVTSTRARRARIDVDIRGVKVVIPEGSGLDPEKLVEQKRDWIEKKLNKFAKHREKIPERRFEEGAVWPFLDRGHLLEVSGSESKRVKKGTGEAAPQKIILNEGSVNRNSVQEELEHFYREAAREYITDLAEKWSVRLQVDYNKIYIRNQRTKWGSCSSKSNLNFNFRLIMAPPKVVEYIVIHELCHLIQPNHSPKFKRLLSSHLPNHAKHRQWLNENSVKLIFTEDDL